MQGDRRQKTIRRAWWAVAVVVVGVLVYLMATADTGPSDPTEAGASQAHATVVANSAIIVFREGLEAVLIFAAVTASFLGANRARRRPVGAGAGLAFVGTVATWFVVVAALSAASPPRPRGPRAGRPAPGGAHRLPRHRGPARRPQLVRAPRLLVGVDRPPPPPAARAAHPQRARRHDRAGRAGLHERVPGGLRGRAVPPVHAAHRRRGHRARGRRA